VIELALGEAATRWQADAVSGGDERCGVERPCLVKSAYAPPDQRVASGVRTFRMNIALIAGSRSAALYDRIICLHQIAAVRLLGR
jgi:hypothetical protein